MAKVVYQHKKQRARACGSGDEARREYGSELRNAIRARCANGATFWDGPAWKWGTRLEKVEALVGTSLSDFLAMCPCKRTREA